MTYHVWGDDWPHWNDLYEAEIYIQKYVYNTSYCILHSKEKFGTIRYSYLFPKYYNIWKVPKIGKFIETRWLAFGKKKLKEAVFSAVHKWPHLKDELTEDYLWVEGLE